MTPILILRFHFQIAVNCQSTVWKNTLVWYWYWLVLDGFGWFGIGWFGIGWFGIGWFGLVLVGLVFIVCIGWFDVGGLVLLYLLVLICE